MAPPRNRSRYPVTSFGPELLALLLQGVNKRVEVECKTFAEMTHLQMRLHMLRSAMRREKHPHSELVQRARTSRMWDGGRNTRTPMSNFRLIVEPNDARFRDMITAAGVTIDESHVEDLLDNTAPPDTPGDPSLAPSVVEADDAVSPYDKFK